MGVVAGFGSADGMIRFVRLGCSSSGSRKYRTICWGVNWAAVGSTILGYAYYAERFMPTVVVTNIMKVVAGWPQVQSFQFRSRYHANETLG